MSAHPRIPAIVVAGTHSGVGKTTVTTGLIAALRARGLVVQAFKCGPDYIDPGYLSAASGRLCRNLDSWMLGPQGVRESFRRACEGADIAVVEGVMGLYDGSDYNSNDGSAAHVAGILGAAVVLVADISGAARSVAATVLGFANFEPGLRLSGVILNRAGSENHAQGCAAAIRQVCGLPSFGWLPKSLGVVLPERHLGLVTAAENAALPGTIAQLAGEVAARFELDALVRLASGRGLPRLSAAPPAHRSAHSEATPVLAVARDEAFCFYYPDNLECLQDAGVRISYFSPVAGESPEPGADGVYLGGGYPELHAAAISSNQDLFESLRALHAQGAPLFAECGGFMVLCNTLVDLEGRSWPMAGLVPGSARMTKRLVGLGYREITALADNLLCASGNALRGHEFHHSEWVLSPEDRLALKPAWDVRDTRAQASPQAAGHAERGLLASYMHVHFGQDPLIAPRVANLLRQRAMKRNLSVLSGESRS